ncbi:hypothetical protein TNCV_4925151 [Trichonephila clavipes]|nr:hypothetical protein TNCV_4925151 [Trichonephila clavipes]
MRGFGTCTIQPRPCSERFPPLPVPQTQSWREAFQWQRKCESGHELLAVQPDLSSGYVCERELISVEEVPNTGITLRSVATAQT